MLLPIVARVSSPFGWRTIAGRSDYHSGTDYYAPIGTPVHAVAAGRVVDVWEPGELARYGRTIVLRHPATPAPLYSLSAHLQSAQVRKGDQVTAGQVIATSGNTAGTRDEPHATIAHAHLHHELLTRWPPRGIDLDRIDPAPYLTQRPVNGQLPAPRTSSSAIGGAAFVALAAALWYSGRDKKMRRPVTTRPALDPPTQPVRSWQQ